MSGQNSAASRATIGMATLICLINQALGTPPGFHAPTINDTCMTNLRENITGTCRALGDEYQLQTMNTITSLREWTSSDFFHPLGNTSHGDLVWAPNVDRLYAFPSMLSHNAAVDPATQQLVACAHVPLTGKITCVPFNRNGIFTYDPVNHVKETVANITAPADNAGEFADVAFCPDTGKLYAAPFNATGVLVVDPITKDTSLTSFGSFEIGNMKYSAIAWSPFSKKLYAAPWNAESVLIINPKDNSTDNRSISGLGATRGKFSGVAFSPTSGYLYTAPFNADYVLQIGTILSISYQRITGAGLSAHRFLGMVYSSQLQQLLAAPYDGECWLVVNPLTHDVSTSDYCVARKHRGQGPEGQHSKPIELTDKATQPIVANTNGTYSAFTIGHVAPQKEFNAILTEAQVACSIRTCGHDAFSCEASWSCNALGHEAPMPLTCPTCPTTQAGVPTPVTVVTPAAKAKAAGWEYGVIAVLAVVVVGLVVERRFAERRYRAYKVSVSDENRQQLVSNSANYELFDVAHHPETKPTQFSEA